MVPFRQLNPKSHMFILFFRFKAQSQCECEEHLTQLRLFDGCMAPGLCRFPSQVLLSNCRGYRVFSDSLAAKGTSYLCGMKKCVLPSEVTLWHERMVRKVSKPYHTALRIDSPTPLPALPHHLFRSFRSVHGKGLFAGPGLQTALVLIMRVRAAGGLAPRGYQNIHAAEPQISAFFLGIQDSLKVVNSEMELTVPQVERRVGPLTISISSPAQPHTIHTHGHRGGGRGRLCTTTHA